MRNDPPAKPACVGKNPELFDWPEFAYAAIEICNECPVQAWCLREVDPARSYFDGVAGGHQWRDGQVLNRYSDPRNDTILQIYLSQAIYRKMRPTNMDLVRDFVVGKAHRKQLTLLEAIEAARLLHRQHVPADQIQKLTRLSMNQIADIQRTTKQAPLKRTENDK